MRTPQPSHRCRSTRPHRPQTPCCATENRGSARRSATPKTPRARMIARAGSYDQIATSVCGKLLVAWFWRLRYIGHSHQKSVQCISVHAIEFNNNDDLAARVSHSTGSNLKDSRVGANRAVRLQTAFRTATSTHRKSNHNARRKTSVNVR